MSDSAPRIVCNGCGAELPPTSALPFACPAKAEGDDIDHVLALSFDASSAPFPSDGEPNPFIRYRRLLWTWHAAMQRGLSDRDYCELVAGLDRKIAAVDGRGFEITPYRHSSAMDAHYKDETQNVAGSHKARHLMGIATYLDVLEASGAAPWTDSPQLAIASCGNAALAAAVVAKAAGRSLRVFIPSWAGDNIVARLRALGAELQVCERRPEDPPGDPCYRQFRFAVAAGALPFSCQGSDNGLTIDGGRTLGYELAAAFSSSRVPSHLFVQVGGGALASASFQALETAVSIGVIGHLPALVTVQSEGGHPLHRAWTKLTTLGDARAALDAAKRQRSAYMWPWESEPKSLADGILDDETYDWWQVARGMANSGGHSVLAAEQDIEAARELARAEAISASYTGVASLAGLIAVRRRGDFEVDSPAVLITGTQR